MPRMIPATGPRGGAACPRAEATVHARLDRTLSADWLVVHRGRWLGRSQRTGAPLDGEAAFVVAHPLHGILALEVVGGGLRYDPNGDSWRSAGTDARPLQDPFLSAESAATTLLAKLREHPGSLPSLPVVGHAVVTPDLVAPSRGFAPHAPADLTLDLTAMDHLGDAIERVLAIHARRRPAIGNAPASWWWRALEDLFLAPREARVLLRHRIAEEHQAIVALSPQQLGVLDMLTRVRRQAIYGSAGTGKTLLAMHKARLLARQGMRVLLTCYNKALGKHLHAAMAGEPNVTAIHFHELCYDIGKLTAKGILPPRDPAENKTFFDEGLAGHLVAAAREQGPRFDALVVDEAQDFLPAYWTALDSLCVDPERAVRYLFFDDAQRLRDDAAPVAGADEALVLTANWRNTQAIHAHLTHVLPGRHEARCLGPVGGQVEFEPLRPTLGKALRRVLNRLCAEGGVDPADVVILTGHKSSRSRLWEITQDLGPFRLTDTDEPGAVRVYGVRAFKGMEAPVVILTELDHVAPNLGRQLHYIGASRATSLLVVLGDAVVPEAVAPTLPGLGRGDVPDPVAP